VKLSDWPTKNVVRRYAVTMIAEGRGEAVSLVDLQRRRWRSQSQYWQEEADRRQAILQEEAERSQWKGPPG
jgi:hypothetical protein